MSASFYAALPRVVSNAMLFGLKQRLALYEMLGSLVKGGVPIDVALRRLYERKAAKNRPESFILRKWLTKMDHGMPFHDAIKDEVPAAEQVLIIAGGMSDDLHGGLAQAVRATKGAQEIKNVLIGGMSQPAFLMLAVFGVLIGFAKYMAPEFSQMLPEARWAGYSGMLLRVSQFVASWWVVVMAAIAAVVSLFFWSLPRWTGPVRGSLDHRLPYSVYRSYSAATFLIALSALLRAGIPLDGALKRIRANSSPWQAAHVGKMLRKMENGSDPGTAMDTGLVDDATSDQLYIYSKSVDFSAALKDIGEDAIVQGVASIRSQTGFAKLVALVCVGAMVSWIQLSLFDLEQRFAEPEPVRAPQVVNK